MEPELSALIVNFIARANDTLQDVHDWSTGTATGGPGRDGFYPIRNLSGNASLALSPAAVAARMPTGQPFALTIPCYADDEIVHVATEAGWMFAPAPMRITTFALYTRIPDQSPTNTIGIQADLRVDGASILSRELRLPPGMRSSRSPGISQVSIVNPNVSLNSLMTVAVSSGGLGATGLRGVVTGQWQ